MSESAKRKRGGDDGVVNGVGLTVCNLGATSTSPENQDSRLMMSSDQEGSDDSVEWISDQEGSDDNVEWFIYAGGIVPRGVQCTYIQVENTTRIDDRAFENCKEHLRVVEICEGVEEIGRMAFSGCKYLESVVSIGGWAFHKCASIESITLPPTLQAIEESAFCDCTSLEMINIPSSVTFIGNRAFSGCKKLKKVTFQSPHHLRTIGQRAFQYCLALEEIKIPPKVTEACHLCFYFCLNLKKVDLCGGSPKVYRDAFDNCPKLDHSSIIATGKINMHTFRKFARADLSSRIASMTDERKSIISEKLDSIPNHIAADSDSSDDDDSNSDSGDDGSDSEADRVVGRISQTMQDILAMIHGLITYWELKEPLTMLELAIWKLNLGSEADVKYRQQIRSQCGRDMQVIISGVLQFFDYNTNDELCITWKKYLEGQLNDGIVVSSSTDIAEQIAEQAEGFLPRKKVVT